MSERYPRVRLRSEKGHLLIRESVSITFYMHRSHLEVVQPVLRALEVYRRAVGPEALASYVDSGGEWRRMDDVGWAVIRQRMLQPRGANILVREVPQAISGYEFTYQGKQLEPTAGHDPEVVCAVSFWLPTEYLEAHGPQRVRALALELADGLPFNSGYVGLSFHYFSGSMLGTDETVRDLCLRYPGLDIPDPYITMYLGTRIRGVSWLTFLGQPVLGALGGVEGLRARLHCPGVSVQDLGGERSVVTLGEWPEAGDMDKGHTLPAYRELACVLEPWLYQERIPWSIFSAEAMRRWERRFLDEDHAAP